MNKKEFALNAIKPYFKDPSLCGIDAWGRCLYYTPDGKMCVLGKYLKNPQDAKHTGNAQDVLEHGQNVLREEAQGILTTEEWNGLQKIHDAFGLLNYGAPHVSEETLKNHIANLGLFTWEELNA